MTLTAREPTTGGTTSSDAQVIQASFDDPEQFAEIYHRHARSVFGFAASRLGRQAADDVTAETFMAAFRIRRRFDLDRQDARPWLLGIAVRQVARCRREEVAHYRTVAALAPHGQAPSGAGAAPDERAVRGVLPGPLMAALEKLRPAERDVLLLMAWDELSYQEVADALEVPIGTVRSRLHRVRRRLRALIPDLQALNEEDMPWTT